ncbi:hypothetical protein LCGC14_1503190 [marine sediment metagenome]|uniref:Transposase n=1 Tax=marine sediment metagenome TaxID=412755 RepID=A0A0F9JP98_9ZZZZ
MYSYEERMRAVKLYIKLGKRLGATIRELGYPTKNALKGWHREYQRLRECPIFCVIAIWSMLPERSKDDDHIRGTAGRTTEGLRAA